jgi:hypothetical protein
VKSTIYLTATLLVIGASLTADASEPTCEQRNVSFEKFLSEHSTGPNKATISVVRREFGAPTSVQDTGAGFSKALYVYPDCLGEVMIDPSGFVWMARATAQGPRSGSPEAKRKRLADLDSQISDLQRRLIALQELRAALGDEPLTWDNALPKPEQSVAPSPKTEPLPPSLPETTSSNSVRDTSANATTASDQHTLGQSNTGSPTIYTGPRGGRYHYSSSGKKVYERQGK